MKQRALIVTLAVAAAALPAAERARAGVFSSTNYASGAMNDANIGVSTNYHFPSAADVIGTGTTVNGVAFVGSGASPFGADWALVGVGNQYGAGNGNKGNVTGNITALFNSFQYGGNPGSIVFSNLTAGRTYEATFYSQTWEGPRPQLVTASGGGSIVYEQDPGGGSLLRYAFVATDATERVTFAVLRPIFTYHFYGFTRRDVFNNDWNAGGDGSFNADGNWTRLDAGAPIGVPDAVGLSAGFPAAGAPANVTVDGSVTLGHVQLDGANAYTLSTTNGSVVTLQAEPGGVSALSVPSGTHAISVPLVLNNDAAKLGAGTLDLAGTISGGGGLRSAGGLVTPGASNSYGGATTLQDGTLAVSQHANLGAPTNAVVFEGGVLRVTGTSIGDFGSHAVNWGSFNGGLDIADEANAFTITNVIGDVSAAGIISRSGAGAVIFTNSVVTKQVIGLDEGPTFIENGSSLTAQTYASIGRLPGLRAAAEVRAGARLVATADLNVGDAVGSTGTLTLVDGGVLQARTLYVGKFGTAVGALHLTGGAVGPMPGAGDWRIGGGGGTNDTGAYGYVRQTGGSFHGANNFQLGAFGLAQYDLLGGAMSNTGGAAVSARYTGSRGTFNVMGGAYASSWGFLVGEMGEGFLNVADAAMNLAGSANGFALGGWQANGENGTGTVNLAAGGLVTTPLVRKGSTVASLAAFNFDGGALRASANNAAFMQGLDRAYVWDGGANFDSDAFSITVAQSLDAPTGDGVVSIALASGGAGYVGPPLVALSGGGGTGATALAQIDPAAGAVTNVVVTCPGVDYTSAPSVAFLGGGGAGAAAGAVTLAPNGSGGLTKLGSGTLALNGTNTYAGDTAVEGGVLLVGSTQAVGNGTIFLATTNLGVGASAPMDQPLLDWLVSRLDGELPRVLALGANTTNDLDVSSPALANASLGAGGGSFTFSGGLTGIGTNLYLGGSPGTLTYEPVIGTGTNVFIGYAGGSAAGAVVLSGSNVAYGSEINVHSGALRPGAANSLGSATARVVVAGGTALDVNGQNSGPVPVFVEGSGIGGAGAIVNSGAQQLNALQHVTLSDDATFGGANRWDIRGAGSVLDLAGFTLTKTGANYVAFNDTAISDGSIEIGQGVVSFEAGTTWFDGAGEVGVGPSGTLQLWNLAPTFLKPIVLRGGTLTALAGVNNVGGSIELAGASNSVGGAASLVVTGVVSGSGALLKTGIGNLRLVAAETYTGQTVVNAGLLELVASNPLGGTIGASAGLVVNGPGVASVSSADGLFGTNSRPIALNSGGMLTTSNGVHARLAVPISLAGGILEGGDPDAVLGNWSLETSVAVTADSVIVAPRAQLGQAGGVVFDVAADATLLAGGTLEDPGLGADGTGTLVKAGAGTMALGGTNTYSGPTIVSDGTLRLGVSLPTGVVARYAFDGDTTDASGNGRDGALTGVGAGFVPGRFGQALELTGSQYVAVPFDAGLQLTNFTVSAWVRMTASPGTFGIVGTRFGGENTFDAKIQATLLHGDIGSGTGWLTTAADAAVALPIDAWQMVTYVVTANGYRIHLNGAQIAAGAFAGVPLFMKAGQTLGIGNDYSGGEYMNGLIDDVNIYGRALTASEIGALYALSADGVANRLPPLTPVLLASAGVLDLNDSLQTIGSLADFGGAGGVVLNGAAGAATLVVGGDGRDTIFSGSVLDGAGAVALTKVEAGTLTLAGAQAYSGATLVMDGTLLVNGSLGNSEVTVFSSGTLGGTGTLGGSVANDGVVAPGESAGRLTIGGTYFQFGGTLDIEISGLAPGSGHDQLVVGDTATVEGTLTVTTPAFTPAAGNAFTILTASAVSGPFSATNLPSLPAGLSWGVNYATDAIVLQVSGTATSRYETWKAQFGVVQGPEGDDDSDGYRNLLEYATGANPTNIDAAAKMNGGKTNGVLYLRFTRDPDSTDVRYWVEGANATSNNAAWSGVATNIGGSWGGAANVQETGVNPRTVTVSDTVVATQRFMRLRVTRP
jgi:autotransporter-associated beta strand protein